MIYLCGNPKLDTLDKARGRVSSPSYAPIERALIKIKDIVLDLEYSRLRILITKAVLGAQELIGLLQQYTRTSTPSLGPPQKEQGRQQESIYTTSFNFGSCCHRLQCQLELLCGTYILFYKVGGGLNNRNYEHLSPDKRVCGWR